MTDILARLAVTASGSVELSIVVKATLVLSLTFVGARVTRRARASVRHLLLASAFGVLLALPAVAILLPPLTVAVPSAGVVDDTVRPAVRAHADAFPDLTTGAEGASASSTGRPAFQTSTLVRFVWAGGFALFLAPLVTALCRLRAIRQGGAPWPAGAQTARMIARRAGIRRSVDVLLHETIATPLTCGFARPAIVMPADARAWTQADIRRAMVHELEHVRRADWPVQLVSRVVCAIYFFHPLAWVAWRHLCLESERACDDAVLRDAESTAYAAQLVTLAARASHPALRPALSMANRSDLSARVTALLDGQQARGRAGLLRAATVVGLVGLLALTISPLRAIGRSQAQAPASGPTFEVASVKPNHSGDGRVMFQNQPGGRYTATNVTLRLLIRQAYQLQDFQIIGGPSWLNDDHYDIVAKADPAQQDARGGLQRGDGPTPIQLMIRALLAERFNLVVHNEKRDLPIYGLILARSDGRLGPDLKKSETDCAALLAAARGRGGALPPPPGPGQPMPCGVRIGPGNLVMGGSSLSQLASSLSMFVGRVVLDRTGLTGPFDINLTWTPDQMPQRPPGAPDPPPLDPSGPSIFTAVQEQLGLKLDSQRGPVDVLVIDRAEHPSPN
jgi:bla regulator protein BlaR1